MRIALDAMGGDLAPKAVIEGAVLAARDLRAEIVLVGDREMLTRELAEHHAHGLALTIEHAAEVVAMDDSPLESVLGKPDSSIHVGLEMVKRGRVDAFVSAGNSGAVMAAAMAILGTLPGIDRPAIASPAPTTGGLALLIDAGANTDVRPLNLLQFGVMGSVYWHCVRGVARPRVGLLSNGEEDSKGTDLTRAAAAALRQMEPHINYIGYVEGRDINRAKADVIVTDGFTGNVALKTMEGFASFMMGNLREVFGSGLLRRLAYMVVRGKLRAIRARLDPSEYGGAPLLGVNGVAIIAHGSSDARAIRNAVRAAANEALVRQVNVEILEVLKHCPATIAARPSNKGIRGVFLRMRERLHRHRMEIAAGPIEEDAAWPDFDNSGSDFHQAGAVAENNHHVISLAPAATVFNGVEAVASSNGTAVTEAAHNAAADPPEASPHAAEPEAHQTTTEPEKDESS